MTKVTEADLRAADLWYPNGGRMHKKLAILLAQHREAECERAARWLNATADTFDRMMNENHKPHEYTEFEHHRKACNYAAKALRNGEHAKTAP